MGCDFSKQLKMGTKIELEHKHLFPKNIQNKMARKIAIDHIKEIPCYYSALVKMERGLKKANRK